MLPKKNQQTSQNPLSETHLSELTHTAVKDSSEWSPTAPETRGGCACPGDAYYGKIALQVYSVALHAVCRYCGQDSQIWEI